MSIPHYPANAHETPLHSPAHSPSPVGPSLETPDDDDSAKLCLTVNSETYFRLLAACDYDAQHITKHSLRLPEWALSCLVAVVEEIENVAANANSDNSDNSQP